MLVDNDTFAIGSSNFDYRSFRYMYEIMLIGRHQQIVEQFKQHISKTVSESIPFDLNKWEDRPIINRFFEWLLLPFRHLL